MFNTVWNLKSFASKSNGAVIALFTATPCRLNEKNVTFRALGHLVNSEKKGYGRIISSLLTIIQSETFYYPITYGFR